MKRTDKQIDDALAELWIAQGGQEDDGYEIAALRKYVRRVLKNLTAVAAALEPSGGKVDVKRLERVFNKLVSDDYDPKHDGMCWEDIGNMISDVLEAFPETTEAA